MNTADNALLLTRSLLRDEKAERFSDEELCDCMQRVQDELIVEFRVNIKHLSLAPAYKKDGTFTLPWEIAYIYALRFNSNPIDYGSPAKHTEDKALLHLGDKLYIIKGHTPSSDDCLDIVASAFGSKLEHSSSPLSLDSSFNKALSLGIVCECLLREPSEGNMSRLSFYEREFEKEKARLRAKANRANTKRVIETKASF